MNERELISQARDGDRDAFETLVRTHELRVRRLAASILLDSTAAEDAAQEVFIKAWRPSGGIPDSLPGSIA